MEKSDYVLRGLIKDLNIRFMLTESTCTVSSSIAVHDTDPVSTIIFGQALTVGALCSAMLNEGERYNLRWNYNGLLRQLIVDVGSDARLRGIPSESHLMEKAKSEMDIFGESDGKVAVIKSCDGRILNSGTAVAGLLDPVDDMGFFFSSSDQIETEIECLVSLSNDLANPVDCAAGMMLQAMPGCDLESFGDIRGVLHSEQIRQLLKETMPSEKKLWKLLECLTGMKLPEESSRVTYTFGATPEYHCTCNQEKLRLAMLTLGREELKKIFDSDETPLIKCEFCNHTYRFTREDFEL